MGDALGNAVWEGIFLVDKLQTNNQKVDKENATFATSQPNVARLQKEVEIM